MTELARTATALERIVDALEPRKLISSEEATLTRLADRHTTVLLSESEREQARAIAGEVALYLDGRLIHQQPIRRSVRSGPLSGAITAT